MKKAAVNVGAMSIGIMPLAGTLANKWVIPPGNVSMAGADYPTRAAVAVFGLTANTVKEGHLFTRASWTVPMGSLQALFLNHWTYCDSSF
jgi:hypothetical protein